MANSEFYGIMAKFGSAEAVVEAAHQAHKQGYRQMDAYSPFPIEGLSEALGQTPTKIPLIVLIAGMCGATGGYMLQYFAMVISYPINTGGRPLHSWPAFVPVTFEMTILSAALTAVFSMILLNRLPMHYHPVFNVPEFVAASRDKFFLCIEAKDPQFEKGKVKQFLEGQKPEGVYDVEE